MWHPYGDWAAAAIVGVVALALLGLSEWLRRLGASPEVSRKTAHIGSGVLAALFPYLFESPWVVTALAGSFIAVVASAGAIGQLRGVHGVERKSVGAYVFPAVIAGMFWLTQGHPELYVIPMLVLALSDAAAALVGKAYGTVKYRALGEARSLEGSAAFFIVTFLVVQVPLLLYYATGRVETVLIAAGVAFLVTCLEAISVRGLDNLFIPFGAWYALDAFLRTPDFEAHWQRLVFFAAGTLATLSIRRAGQLTRTGAVASVLCGYLAWAMGGVEWLAPLVIGYLLLMGLGAAGEPDTRLPPMGLSRIVQVTAPGVAVLFAWDLTTEAHLFGSYLAATSAATVVAGLRVAEANALPRALALVAGALLPPLAASPWLDRFSPWLLLLGAGGGLLAGVAAFALQPTTAVFRCTECGVMQDEPRHCGAPAELVRGNRQWTRSRAGLAVVSVVVLSSWLVGLMGPSS